MKLRVARHTVNLDAMVEFYTQVIGMEVLGSFIGHEGYDGIFMGYPESDWHLEFTSSANGPVHSPDEDDLLVFYPASMQAYNNLLSRLEDLCINSVKPVNPYWQSNATCFKDPDGYGIVFVQPGKR